MTDPNFWLAAFGGFAGAYMLSLAGYWMEGHLGLPRFDVAESGKRYLGGDAPGWWVVGTLSHSINGILLGELYAVTFYPITAAWSTNVLVSLITGAFYGVVVWVVLLNLLVLPLSGAGPFGWNTGSAKLGYATLALHIVFGAIVGLVYRPW